MFQVWSIPSVVICATIGANAALARFGVCRVEWQVVKLGNPVPILFFFFLRMQYRLTMYDKTWLEKKRVKHRVSWRLDCSQRIPSSFKLSAGEIHLVSLHDLQHLVPGMKNSKNVILPGEQSPASQAHWVLSPSFHSLKFTGQSQRCRLLNKWDIAGVFSQTRQTLTSFSRSSWSTGFAFAPFRCAWATNSKVTKVCGQLDNWTTVNLICLGTQKGAKFQKWQYLLESWECWEVKCKPQIYSI